MNSDRLNGLSQAEKRLLLLKALQQKSGALEESHPLSLFQEGLLFIARLQPDSAQYNMPHILRLRGSLNQAALERSVHEIIRRHAPLRTAFSVKEDGQAVQTIQPFQPQPLTVVDLRTLPEDGREAQAQRQVQDEGQYRFDLAAGGLFRYRLLRLREDEHWFVFVAHHSIFDLLSLEVFLEELRALYTAYAAGRESPLEDLAFTYANFARWQQQWLQGQGASAQLAYWRQNLAGPLPLLELPTDHPRPAEPAGPGALFSFELPGGLAERLGALGRQEGATLFMTLLAAFDVLLHRYTHQDDILVGTPVASRNRAELANLIGLLINTVALRADLSGAPTFRQLLRRVQAVALDAFSHQDLPFTKVVEAVQPDRGSGRSPIFQVMFALEQGGLHLDLPGLDASVLDNHHGTAKFDLTLLVREQAGGLAATFEYRTDLFEEATIARMAGHFARLLASLAESPDQSIATAPFLAPDEVEQLLVGWNDTAREVPQQHLIHELVRQRAAAAPTSLAAVHGAQQLTYAQLDARSDQLAAHLRTLGVGPDVLVGVAVERSLDMLVGLLAVLKAGGAYVPMDPALPSERLRYMLADAQAPVVLTSREIGDWRLEIDAAQSPISNLQSPTLVYLDADWETIAQQPHTNSDTGVTVENVAYVIYTSGSTGTPKGVAVTHANLLNLVSWHLRTFQVTAADRCTQLVSPGFDASVWEIWTTLAAGACLYIVDDETRLAPGRLRDWMLDNQITLSITATPLAEALLALPWPTHAALRYLFTGGDRLRQYPRPELPFTLMNMYGPTECTVLSTWTAVPSVAGDRAPSIGRPIDNTQLYVLDAHMQPVPIGVAGELHIGGAGVARGYHRRPELTDERFVSNPFASGRLEIGDWRLGGETPISNLQSPISERLYKTGDLVRYLPDGNIEYLGRIDGQVKIRGFRIELGEIETALSAHPSVREALVVAREDTPGDKRLVAYIVPGDWRLEIGDSASDNLQSPISNLQTELRGYLKTRLPDYMIPAAFVFLDALPLTPNGKIDRRALPAPELPRRQPDAVPLPAHGVEQTIAAIWKAVLGREQIGLHDNFFDLGGHSLLLVQVHEKLCNAFATDIRLLELFTYPTVGALAGRIGQLRGDAPAADAAEEQRAPAERQPEAEIAIIGMAGRFPGANDIETFWANLRDGVESITWFSPDELLEAGASPAELADPHFVPAKGVMDGADLFDAPFFGITPREAETLDPQQRIFLECAWETLEHAGYDPDRYAGRIGVYAGSSFNTYLLNNLAPNRSYVQMVGMFQVFMSNDKDFLATRAAYKLNLKGPAVAVQTACSTSLVAVHMAGQSLLNGECEMALAGGVSIQAPLAEGYVYREGEVMSPDGRCRAFDAAAQGTVAGTGVGLVLLKRLSDALRDGDQVLATIKGSAINNDGALKVGYTAPSAEGQAEVIAGALTAARVHPDTISYVEAHGTGTALGDPIEIEGLTRAFRKQGARQRGTCAIGSAKTNIGHLDAAAGVTGLIKMVMALQHKQLPASLNYEHPNMAIDFAAGPFFVNHRLTDWEAQNGPRRAGVSSFGVGGTNAHVILEEAPPAAASGRSRPWQVLVLSARSRPALQRATDNLREHLRTHADLNLADIAYTLQLGRKAFAHRRVLVCRDTADALEALDEPGAARLPADQAADGRSIVFMFPGQGAQHVDMARELYQTEPLFRQHVDRCAELLRPHLGLDLRDVLYPDAARMEDGGWKIEDGESAILHPPSSILNQTQYTQPALFVVEYALAQLWMSWGVRPQAMIGHSVGEYVAACLAGVFSLEDALRLVAARGRLVQGCPTGAMLAIPLPEGEILPRLGQGLEVAAVNGPQATVVAGPAEAVAALHEQLAGQGIQCRRLHTSHAFHSAMMDSILEPFAEQFTHVKLAPPTIPLISNVTGAWLTAEDATDPRYWARHLRSAVRFADGLETLYADGQRAFVEVGPGVNLGTLARQQPGKGPGHVVVSSLRHPREARSDLAVLLSALGRVWSSGAQVDWAGFSRGEQRRRVALPTYPFERQRYWIEAPRAQAIEADHHLSPNLSDRRSGSLALIDYTPAADLTGFVEPSNEIEELIVQAWQDVLGISAPGRYDSFFELGGDSLMAARVINRLREMFEIDVPLSALFEAQTIASLASRIEDLLVEHMDVAA